MGGGRKKGIEWEKRRKKGERGQGRSKKKRKQNKKMRLKIHQFDPSQIKPHRICLFLGRRGSGKSVLLEDIMGRLSDRFDIAMAMAPTTESQHMLMSHMPPAWVYDRHVPEKVEALIEAQKVAVQSGKQRSALLVLDDCMYEKKTLKSTASRFLFLNGRHVHITPLLTMQYCTDMDPSLRAQIDYVFICKENIQSNRIKLYRYFCGFFERYDDFARVMDKCTENHSCLVIDNVNVTNDLERCVYWYKAKFPCPPYSVGSPAYLALASRLQKTQGDMMREAEERRAVEAAGEKAKKKKDSRITTVEKVNKKGRVVDREEVVILA